jgi:hypothetical protein
MLIRFHRNLYVDAVVSTAAQSTGAALPAAPGDVVWQMASDLTANKTITVTQKVQATDPVTGALLFTSDGQPIWQMTNVLDASGNPIPVLDSTGKPIPGKYQQTYATQQVQQTFALAQNPNIFTPADIQAVALSYQVVNG